MNRFLLGALAMGAVFVLTSFAVSGSTGKPTGGPAWTVSQYQLDRAFRTQTVIDGNLQTIVMPPGNGIIITQFRLVSGGPVTLSVGVNGAQEGFTFPANGGGAYELNPPVIARPGDTLTFQAPNVVATIGIAGYTTLPGET